MELPGYFDDFLQAIRPTPEDQKHYQKAHEDLRQQLRTDTEMAKLLVNTFIQGSYRRHTAIRGLKNEKSDIDVVAVTRISPSETPETVKKVFTPFLNKHYSGKWKSNDRSFKIGLDKIELDLVVTAAPSETDEKILESLWVDMDEPPEEMKKSAEAIHVWLNESTRARLKNDRTFEAFAKANSETWKTEPLLIPDRRMGTWEKTHPLMQIEWTWEKNAKTNGHYVNIVKAIKVWKRVCESLGKYPKGYPLEHIVGYCCPDSVECVDQGIVASFEGVVREFTSAYQANQKPKLQDHGVPDHDVLHRLDLRDFRAFFEAARSAAQTARQAYESDDKGESIQLWRTLFGGDPFPEPTGGIPPVGGFSPRSGVSDLGKGRFG